MAVVLAIVSTFFVHPDSQYLTYIDFKTLSILFCLMCVMAGLKELGVFKKIASEMLKSVQSERRIVFILVMLCFFFAMFITNDVALITFVPFTFTTLEMCGEKTFKKYVIPVVVLQTIAANLGSMLTPVGNPQNLYLYSQSGMSLGGFIKTMLPYTLISLVLIVLSILFFTRGTGVKKEQEEKNEEQKPAAPQPVTLTEMFAKTQTKYHSLLIMYILLFVVALTVVMRVLPYGVMLGITLILILLSDKGTLLKVDYSLLVTFVGFFVFIGNMGRIPAFSSALKSFIEGREVFTAVVSSQVMSNVPAALLLSGFTSDYKALMIGTNLGGLGTLIASMASLISYKLVAKKDNVETAGYFKMFTLLNVLFLIILALSYIILR